MNSLEKERKVFLAWIQVVNAAVLTDRWGDGDDIEAAMKELKERVQTPEDACNEVGELFKSFSSEQLMDALEGSAFTRALQDYIPAMLKVEVQTRIEKGDEELKRLMLDRTIELLKKMFPTMSEPAQA